MLHSDGHPHLGAAARARTERYLMRIEAHFVDVQKSKCGGALVSCPRCLWTEPNFEVMALLTPHLHSQF